MVHNINTVLGVIQIFCRLSNYSNYTMCAINPFVKTHSQVHRLTQLTTRDVNDPFCGTQMRRHQSESSSDKTNRYRLRWCALFRILDTNGSPKTNTTKCASNHFSQTTLL
jgi:hypothetical protein